MNWTWFLFNFKGRINRAKWWLALPVLVGWLLSLLLMTTLGDHIVPGGPAAEINIGVEETFRLIGRAAHHSLSRDDIVALAANLFGVTTFMWMLLATWIKRLHDRDRSGWWIVPFFILPSFANDLVDWLPTQYLPDWLATLILTVLGAILLILCIWGLVEMGFLRGSPGPNRFGPDPLAPVAPVAPVDTRPGWDQQSALEFVPHSAGPSPGPHGKRGHE